MVFIIFGIVIGFLICVMAGAAALVYFFRKRASYQSPFQDDKDNKDKNDKPPTHRTMIWQTLRNFITQKIPLFEKAKKRKLKKDIEQVMNEDGYVRFSYKKELELGSTQTGQSASIHFNLTRGEYANTPFILGCVKEVNDEEGSSETCIPDDEPKDIKINVTSAVR